MGKPGERLAERYRLVERIGEGGMGTVWLARDEDSAPARDVAIKVLHKTLVGDVMAAARLHNEARAAGGLDHPNICRVIDVGEHDGAPFLVMERLEGESLAERLNRGPLEAREAADVLLEVLAGLGAAHENGILHRDLKPENVFLVRGARAGARARILDFGVAKFIGDDAERVKMTRTGALVGTPAYMSPEQARGLADVDVRADVWAAGVMLYEMLSRRLPYEAPNYNAALVRIATEPPRAIREVIPAVDAGLAEILAHALAHDRTARLGTAAAFTACVRAWLDGAPLPLRTLPPRPTMPTPRVGMTPMGWAEGATPPRGIASLDTVDQRGDARRRARRNARPWWMPVALAALVGGAGVVALHSMHAGQGATRTAAAATPVATTTASVAPQPVAPVALAPPVAPVARDHALSLIGLPTGARVTIDGAPVASLPARIAHDRPARVDVTAPGFEPWSATVSPSGDVALTYAGHVARPPARRDRASGRSAHDRARRTGIGRQPDF